MNLVIVMNAVRVRALTRMQQEAWAGKNVSTGSSVDQSQTNTNTSKLDQLCGYVG